MKKNEKKKKNASFRWTITFKRKRDFAKIVLHS